mgnify:CR=1 FL=1
MSYREALFRRYGSPSAEGRVEIRDYLLLPEKLTENEIRRYDESAARTIAECEAAIEALKEYRQALAARYAQLTTAPYKLRLEIERDPHWRNQGVDYYVRIIKAYEDGTEIKEILSILWYLRNRSRRSNSAGKRWRDLKNSGSSGQGSRL